MPRPRKIPAATSSARPKRPPRVKPPAAPPVKVVSPSRIARYFFHECRRYLRYSSTPKALWDAEGVPAPPFDHSPVTAAILEGGYAWEEEVIRDRLAGRVVLAEAGPGARLKDRILDADETRRLLQGQRVLL